MDDEAYMRGLESLAATGYFDSLWGGRGLDKASDSGAMAEVLPKVQIRLATVTEVTQGGPHLFREHVEECEPRMAGDLDPNWTSYLDAEAAEKLIVIAAWNKGVMIGYAVASLIYHPHYRKLLVCQQDLLFVQEEWRHERVGLHLINWLRDEARDRGAHHLLMHAKPGSTLESLLPRLGFTAEEITFKETL